MCSGIGATWRGRPEDRESMDGSYLLSVQMSNTFPLLLAYFQSPLFWNVTLNNCYFKEMRQLINDGKQYVIFWLASVLSPQVLSASPPSHCAPALPVGSPECELIGVPGSLVVRRRGAILTSLSFTVTPSMSGLVSFWPVALSLVLTLFHASSKVSEHILSSCLSSAPGPTAVITALVVVIIPNNNSSRLSLAHSLWMQSMVGKVWSLECEALVTWHP